MSGKCQDFPFLSPSKDKDHYQVFFWVLIDLIVELDYQAL
jgi:hypothetical protein